MKDWNDTFCKEASGCSISEESSEASSTGADLRDWKEERSHRAGQGGWMFPPSMGKRLIAAGRFDEAV